MFIHMIVNFLDKILFINFMFVISYFIHYFVPRNHSHNLNSIATSKFADSIQHLAADRSARYFGHIDQFAAWLPLAVDYEKYCVVCFSF